MSVRVTWSGLSEQIEEWRRLPDVFSTQAEHIQQEEANAAAFAIRSRYPVRTGNLRKGVVIRRFLRKAGHVVFDVKNVAKHATIFELGTQARHNKIGANRGSMPPGRVFYPIALQRQRTMFLRLIEMVTRAGFTVTED